MSDDLVPAESLTGACACGAVRYSISSPLVGAAYCHCKRCQRRTGSAFSVTGLTQPGSFEITEGKDSVTVYDPGDGGFLKAFCAKCGGHLYAQNPVDENFLAIRMGSLDEDPGIRPGLHQYVDYAAPWEPIPDDGLPRFAERIAWVDDQPDVDQADR